MHQSKLNFFDFNDRQFLAVADGFMITLAAFHLESELLVAALMFHHVGNDAGAGNGWAADRNLVAADHQNTVKSEWFARLDIKAFDFERVARGNSILFAACF